MPCHSIPQDMADAKLVIKQLKIKHKTVDITKTFDVFKKTLPKASPLAVSNIKPRLRMATLYCMAHTNQYLVAGTGNKSELSVGYFTKYGDGGVDILPIAHLYKTEVFGLAKELGLPERIISKPPSAGLWSGQTDEGEMGITYRELDTLLARIASGKPVSGVLGAKVKKMAAASAHKRALPPSCG